jgi:hypothetical protein
MNRIIKKNDKKTLVFFFFVYGCYIRGIAAQPFLHSLVPLINGPWNIEETLTKTWKNETRKTINEHKKMGTLAIEQNKQINISQHQQERHKSDESSVLRKIIKILVNLKPRTLGQSLDHLITDIALALDRVQLIHRGHTLQHPQRHQRRNLSMHIHILFDLFIQDAVKDSQHAFDGEGFRAEELLAQFGTHVVMAVFFGGRNFGPFGHFPALVGDFCEISHVQARWVVGCEEGRD